MSLLQREIKGKRQRKENTRLRFGASREGGQPYCLLALRRQWMVGRQCARHPLAPKHQQTIGLASSPAGAEALAGSSPAKRTQQKKTKQSQALLQVGCIHAWLSCRLCAPLVLVFFSFSSTSHVVFYLFLFLFTCLSLCLPMSRPRIILLFFLSVLSPCYSFTLPY